MADAAASHLALSSFALLLQQLRGPLALLLQRLRGPLAAIVHRSLEAHPEPPLLSLSLSSLYIPSPGPDMQGSTCLRSSGTPRRVIRGVTQSIGNAPTLDGCEDKTATCYTADFSFHWAVGETQQRRLDSASSVTIR